MIGPGALLDAADLGAVVSFLATLRPFKLPSYFRSLAKNPRSNPAASPSRTPPTTSGR